MLPLCKKGMLVEYTLSVKSGPQQARVFQSNPKAVWIEVEDSGKIIKLHKIRHKIKIVEEKDEGKEVEKPQTSIDDLLNNLSGP